MGNTPRSFFGTAGQDVFDEFDTSSIVTYDTVRLRGGNDFANLFGGEDMVFAGLGNDTINIQPKELSSTATVFGGGGDDTFNVIMNSITASIRGNDGEHDFATICATDAFLIAQDGRKTIIVDDDSTITLRGVETINVVSGSQTSRFFVDNQSVNVFFELGNYPNAIGDDIVYMRGGNDMVTLFGGDDLVFAGIGDDTITINSSPDDTSSATVYAGSGNDRFQIRLESVHADIFGGDGDDTLFINTTKAFDVSFDGDTTTIWDDVSSVTVHGVEDIKVLTPVEQIDIVSPEQFEL